MEHLATFGLTRDPFASEPQLAFTFEARGFQDASRRLQRAAMQGKGLCLVTGRGGVGKTMLVRNLLESLEEEAFDACLLVPVPGVTDARWILSRYAAQLGVEDPEEDLARLLGQVYEQLAIVREDGRTPVLIIDEAQVLADQGVLPALRGLLNLEYEERRLVTLMLVGLPELGPVVARTSALTDRVELRLRMEPLDEEESQAYLAHRIRAAEGNPAILESGAVQALVKWGEGVPRRLNALADNALFEAHLAGRVSATAEDVERAAADLLGDVEPEEGAAVPQPRPAPAPRRPAERESAPEVLFAAAEPEPVGNGLDDVVAAATDPGFPEQAAPAFNGHGPEQTVFLADPPAPPAPHRPSPAVADRTVAFLGESPARPAAAETVALLDDSSEAEGELDDLFADLVDD